MEVCFVSNTSCIRTVKESVSLKENGIDVIHIANNTRYSNFFKNFISYRDIDGFVSAIKMVHSHGVKIFHVHNEPSWFIPVIDSLGLDGIKIVYDIHDSKYWYVGNETREEVENERLDKVIWHDEVASMELSDLMVVPSKECAESIKQIVPHKEVIHIAPACPSNFYKYGNERFVGGLCSQGGHAIPSIVGENHWRNFTKLYTEVINRERSVYAYCSRFKADRALNEYYRSLGVETLSVQYDSLIDKMSCHSWNLVGNVLDETPNVFKYMMPNKFFDGIASGIPSVCFNTDPIREIVEESGMGIICSTTQEFIERWDEHHDKRMNVYKNRLNYSMENMIQPLIDKYKKL